MMEMCRKFVWNGRREGSSAFEAHDAGAASAVIEVVPEFDHRAGADGKTVVERASCGAAVVAGDAERALASNAGRDALDGGGGGGIGA